MRKIQTMSFSSNSRSLGRSPAWVSSITAAFASLVLATACLSSGGGKGGGSSCSPGEEGCECYGNKTCDDGLSCLSKLCVDVSGRQTDDDTSQDVEADGGEEPERTESAATETDEEADETEDETEEEASPEPSAPSDDDGDPTEPSDGPIEPAPSDPAPTPSPTPSSPEPTPSPTPSSPTPTPTPTPAPADSCEPSGSCVDGSGLDCEEGEHIPRVCSGCELLYSCTECCRSVGYFGAYTIDDLFVLQQDLVTSFEQSESAATATFGFTGAYQMGAIAFHLEAPIYVDPSYLEIDLSYAGNVNELTVSLEDNSVQDSGCSFDMYQWTGNVWIPESYVACWGSFTSSVREATSIVVRVGTSSRATSGAATLSVRGVSW